MTSKVKVTKETDKLNIKNLNVQGRRQTEKATHRKDKDITYLTRLTSKVCKKKKKYSLMTKQVA